MIKKLFISLVAIIIVLLTVLQFPNLFIEKKIEYGSFILYSNSDLRLSDEMKNILDSVSINLKSSEFYDANQKLDLYFVKVTLYEKLIRLFGAKNIASSKFNTHIYTGNPDFKNNVLRKGNHKTEWLNLIQIISHEGVHSQMYSDYSWLGFMQTPSWINEGYCEYISYSPIRESTEYDLANLYDKYANTTDFWVETEYKAMTPKQYVRDRILIEYLIDYYQMDILSIIEDKSLEPEELLEEVQIYFE